jgi:peptidyl-prolyl cis-trans isomerase D
MLTELRNVTRGWVAMGVIGLLALAFAIWGINDVFKPIQSNEVASGRNVAVTQTDFNLAFDNELKRARQQSGRPVTRQEAVDANLHMRLIDQLVNQRVFDALARRADVSASDEMVRKSIEETQAFRNQVTGAFDASTYRMLLAQNGLTSTLYEDDVRREMARNQLADALVAGLRPPSSFGRMVIAFESERRTISIAAISPDRVPQPATPTDADLEAFYKAQSAAFALPEYRAFTVIRAEPADFASRVEVPEAKIQELYNFRKTQLVTPEKRSFVLLSGAADRAAAEAAGRRLAAGEDPQAVARALGLQAQVFDEKAKTDAPDARVGDAVFATAAGAVTAPVQGVTWSIARVTKVTPGLSPGLEDVRAQLHAELAQEEAQTLMNDAVEKFDDIRAGGAALEDAATQAGLTLTSIPLVDARGLSASGQPEAAVLDQPEMVQAAFAAAEGDPTDWTSTDQGGSYMIRIDTVKAAGPPPLAQIRDRVALAWRMQKMGDAMRKVADDLRAAVGAGTRFTDAARAQRVPVVATSQTITRQMAGEGGPSRQLMGAVFTGREGDVVTGAGGPGGAILFVAQIEKVERDDPAKLPQLLEQARQSLDGMLANDLLASAQNAARQQARIRLNQPLIDRLVGKTTDDGASK